MSWIKNTNSKVLANATTLKKQKQFGLLLIVTLVAIVGFKLYKGATFNKEIWLIFAAVFLVLLCVILFLPIIYTPFLLIWLFIGEILGAITNTIIMGVVYFVFFSPMAFLTGRKQRRKQKSGGWIEVNREIDYKKMS